MRFIILLLYCSLFVSLNTALGKTILTSESENMVYRVDEVADGLGVVWGMVFLSPNEMLFTEREGRIKKFHLMEKTITEIHGLPSLQTQGQGGLLDVALAPGYTAGDWIYFTYAKKVRGGATTVLARARLTGETLHHWQNLLISEAVTETSRHFGSRIAFDQDGHVFFSVGDRGKRENGQDKATHAGSIIRLQLDGSIPHDNPFTGRESLPEIWSYGHRNPQGLFWDRERTILWSNEHGPRGGDEINRIEAGKNYGWPVASHGQEYWGPVAVGESLSIAGMQDPVKVYIPSIAPSSLIVYSGKAFRAWQGNLFSGALVMTHLNRLVLNENLIPVKEERLLEDLDERIRNVTESPEGYLYLSTDSGRILAILPDDTAQ